jgi:hypothetical protein
MSPSACFNDNHYVGTGSPLSKLYLSKSVTTANINCAAGSSSSAIVNTSSLANPSTGLQLFVDLSF